MNCEEEKRKEKKRKSSYLRMEKIKANADSNDAQSPCGDGETSSVGDGSNVLMGGATGSPQEDDGEEQVHGQQTDRELGGGGGGSTPREALVVDHGVGFRHREKWIRSLEARVDEPRSSFFL